MWIVNTRGILVLPEHFFYRKSQISRICNAQSHMCLVIIQAMWILCHMCSMELVLPNELKCHICDFSKVCDFYRIDMAHNISFLNSGLVKLLSVSN
jgi:hypothetical protein